MLQPLQWQRVSGVRTFFLSLLLYNKNNFINLYHNNIELREEELF